MLHSFIGFSRPITLVVGLLILFFAASLAARDIDQYTSGSWYNPAQTGHGFSVEVLEDNRTIAYWYTYTPSGDSMFLVGSGVNQGNRVTLETYAYDGMTFGEFNPADNTQYYWGTMTLVFHNCDRATLSYSSSLTDDGEEFGSGTIQLTKLASIDGMQCSPNPNAGLYQGNFYSETFGRVIPGWAAIAPNGEFAAVSFEAMAGVGTWSVRGTTFQGSGTAVSADPDFTFSSSLSLSGETSPGYRMIGNYRVSGGDRGTFEMFAVPALYRRGISLSDISGSYTAQNLVTGFRGNASITQSGRISGSDSFGCVYGGQITILDPSFNLFEATVTVSQCGVSDGTYQGYGAQIDYYQLEDGRALRLIGTNGKYAGVFDLYR